MLHGQIFNNPLFDFLKPVVIFVQHLFGAAQVLFDTGFFAPWQAQHPVQIVAHNSCLGAHRAHVFQLFQLGFGLIPGLLAQLGCGQFGLKLGHFAFALFAIAQLFLNGLHLLIQIIFTLGALHLRFHAGFDLLLNLKNAHLALHQAINLFQPLGHAQRFQQVLLLVHFNAQMPRHQIGQLGRFGGFRYSAQRLFGDVLLDLGIALKFGRDGAQQCLNRGGITGHFQQCFGAGLKIIGVFQIFQNAHTLHAFNKHLHSAVGQFQQLQNIGQHTRIINSVRIRVIITGVDLARQQDLLVVLHHLFEGTHGFFTAHKKRYNHMRKHHDVAQRQHGVGCVQLVLHVLFSCFGKKALVPINGNARPPPFVRSLNWGSFAPFQPQCATQCLARPTGASDKSVRFF